MFRSEEEEEAMRQNHGFQFLLETALNLLYVLIELLRTEKRVSRNTPHKRRLEEPTPHRSQRLGPPRRVKLLSSLAEYLFKSDRFFGLGLTGSTFLVKLLNSRTGEPIATKIVPDFGR